MCHHDASMLPPLKKLNTTLHPLFLVSTHHQARLIIEAGILAVDLDISLEIARLALVIKMTVIDNDAVIRHAPEIRPWGRAYGQRISLLGPGWRFVQPLHQTLLSVMTGQLQKPA